MPPDVVAVGEITVDHYPDLNQRYVGGIALNFAVHARRVGAPRSSLVSRVGRGPAGRRIRDVLCQEGVDAAHVAARPGATAAIDVRFTPDGDRYFPSGSYRVNVLAGFCLDAAEQAFIRQHDFVASHYDGPDEGSISRQLTAGIGSACRHVVDFGDRAGGVAEIVTPLRAMTADDLAFVSGDRATLQQLMAVADSAAVPLIVTMGAEGSAVLGGGRPILQPALTVAAVRDPTGCGDAFQAAFTVAYGAGASPAMALERAAEVAADVVGHYGSIGVAI